MTIIEQFFILLFKILESIFQSLFELIRFAWSAIPARKDEYNANFASPSSLLSKRNSGFCLTGRRNLSVKHSYQNALVVGGTGTGKSSVVLFPSLYTMKGSFVIHDPSGELYLKSAGYLKQRGYEVKVLNYSKPISSSGYNPLIRATSSSDIQKVASLLVENSLGGKSKDPFWNTQAVALLAMLIAILKKQEPHYQNLFNVRQLLNRLGADPKSVDALFAEKADEILFAEYKSFIAYEEKVVSSIIATCKAALQLFNDDSIAKVTSIDNIDLMSFRTRPTALFIQNSVADQKYYSVLTSLFFEQFFAFLMSRMPKDDEKDIFILIDEASSLYLPTLSLAVANVRKHRAGIMLLVQDFNQLVHHYGKQNADAIKANCFAKMYFTGTSLETSKELEQTLGQYQYEDDKKRTVVRPLMTNDEIRTMKQSNAILICGHHRPIFATLKPYYKQSRFSHISSIPAPDIFSPSLAEQVPILPIQETINEQA